MPNEINIHVYSWDREQLMPQFVDANFYWEAWNSDNLLVVREGAQSVVGLVRPPHMSEISEGETTTGGV